MHESDRGLLNILYRILHPIYRYSGIESICNKARVTEEKQPKRILPSLPLWLFGIYIALFGLASQRYENRVDIIERKVNSIYTRLTPITSAIMRLTVSVDDATEEDFERQWWPLYEELDNNSIKSAITKDDYNELVNRNELMMNMKSILSKIPVIQHYPCPVAPSLFKPHVTILSFFENTPHKVTVEELKELILGYKRKLSKVNLDGVDLKGADLRYAMLLQASLMDANLQGANLYVSRLQGASLTFANLEGANLGYSNLMHTTFKHANLNNANLKGANLNNARLKGAKLNGANLELANLIGVENLTIDQLSTVKTLFKVRNLDSGLMKQVKEKYPHLLEKPQEEE